MNRHFFSANSSANKITSDSTRHKKRTLTAHLFPLYLLLLLFIQTVDATGYYAEVKTSQALQKQLPSDEIVWLTDGAQTKTLALVKKASGEKNVGAAIILADLGRHPDWPIFIRPLRHNLARHGWRTLSVYMPQIKSEPSSAELDHLYQLVKVRIKLALDYMANPPQNLVIIAQGHTANMAVKYLAENPVDRQKISAFVGISLFDSSWMQTSQYLEKVPNPILDVFAEYDNLNTLTSAPTRLATARRLTMPSSENFTMNYSLKTQALAKKKTGSLRYRQTLIHGAYADFSFHQATLIKTIRGWLQNYTH